MKTITEYIQKKHIIYNNDKILNAEDLIADEYYVLKKDENVYDIFKFKETTYKAGECRIYYSELVVIDTDLKGKPVYFNDKNTTGNYLQETRIKQRKLYNATEEDIAQLKQARIK